MSTIFKTLSFLAARELALQQELTGVDFHEFIMEYR